MHFNVRLDDDRLAALVLVGARPDGTKELIAIEDGYRESTESWATLLRDLKRRGMQAPVVAVGDGALGFWAASLVDNRDRLLTFFDLPTDHCKHVRTTNQLLAAGDSLISSLESCAKGKHRAFAVNPCSRRPARLSFPYNLEG